MDGKAKDDISNMKLVPLTESRYMKPLRVEFKMNGIQKYWDMLQVHDSVSILIFNTSRNVVVLVKQFRPSMYIAQLPDFKPGLEVNTSEHSLEKGYSLELCAGIVDKDAPRDQIAKEEVLEETGYDVPVDALQVLYNYRAVGVTGQLQSLYYVEVTDGQRVTQGGGLVAEGEFIEVVELSIAQLRQYLSSPVIQSPAGFVAATQWFLSNVAPRYS